MNTKIINKIKNDELLNIIIKNFDEEIYLVGGSVRDFLMDKASYDRDLIVCGVEARDFSIRLAEFFDAVFVPLDEENKIYRVVLPDKINYFDITNPLENSIEKDLARRDLTINAIAVNLKTAEVIDLFGGIEDIKNKRLNSISEQNILDDPLRILRAFRFMSVLGFELSEELSGQIQKHITLISKPAVERVNYELMKLFGGKFAIDALVGFDKAGGLELIFPFVKELKQVPPNTHHHLDLFHHSLETMRQIQMLYEESCTEVTSHLEEIVFGAHPRLSFLKFAAFIHDIGKFSTWTIEEETGRHRFIKHEDIGARLAVPYLKKMNFSNKQIDYITCLIKNHMYPSQVIAAPELNEKVMMRFVRKMEDNAIDVILLAMADRFSARGAFVTDEMVNENISGLNKLLNFYLSVKDTLEPLPKLLSGNDIMQLLNIPPSPVLGKIISELHDAQLSGDVMTKDQAVNFVMKFK